MLVLLLLLLLQVHMKLRLPPCSMIEPTCKSAGSCNRNFHCIDEARVCYSADLVSLRKGPDCLVICARMREWCREGRVVMTVSVESAYCRTVVDGRRNVSGFLECGKLICLSLALDPE